MKSSISSNLLRKVQVRLPKDYPWLVLDKLVEDHRYCLTQPELDVIRHVIRMRDYDAYLELSEAWGPCGIDPNGTLALVPFRAKYQIASLMKKYRFPSSNEMRKTAAMQKFLAAEDKCRSYNLTGYKELRTLSDPTELKAFTYALSFLRKLLGPYLPEPDKLTLWSRHGPGANLDTKEGKTSMYDKYKDWPYSCTQLASGYARAAIAADERWLGALEDSYRERHGVPKHLILDQDQFWSSVLTVVDSNRIAFVPKNAQTDRSIAIEPSLNLYLQLGVDGFIRRRLKRWGVDLDDQRKNQRLAYEGSRDWCTDDPYVTLDLSAASDTVSIAVCETLLPSAWFAYLMMLRSPSGKVGEETISYEKISSMGNGYTFALESALFTALVYGAIRAVRGGRFDRDDFAVFGDDIIVRRSVSDLVVRMLELSGFAINPEKSFTQGPFRESCGADYFLGESVRPVFLTEKPTTVMGVWNDQNRLQRLLYHRSLLWESSTIALLDRWVHPDFRCIVGPYSDESFDSYRHVPVPPKGVNRNGVWEIPRIVVKARRRKGCNEFHFRKLMAALRQASDAGASPWSSKTWGGARVTADGTCFAVTDNNAVTVCVAPAQIWNWSGSYSALLPFER